jgi:predicted dehydrogenase
MLAQIKSTNKCAIIGNGRWAENYFDEASKINIFELKKFNLPNIKPDNSNMRHACCSVLSEITAWEADLAIIATLPQAQHIIATHLIEQKLALILEKPFGTDTLNIHKLFQYVKRSSQPILVNHFHFFDEQLVNLHENIGGFNIDRIEIYDGNNGPFRNRIPPLFDWGCHSIAIGIMFYGSYPTEITSITRTVCENSGEVISLQLKFENGKELSTKFGNGFSEKIREIKFLSRHQVVAKINNGFISTTNSFHNEMKLKFKPQVSPMRNLLTTIRDLMASPNREVHLSTKVAFVASHTLSKAQNLLETGHLKSRLKLDNPIES